MDSEKSMILSSFLFPAAILLSSLSYAEPGRSTGWRGDGSGHYPGSQPPAKWAKDENIVWNIKIDHGFSSPVAARGKIFLTADPDKLICIDQASGKVLWEKANGADQLREKPDPEKLDPPTDCGFASPSPCTDGRHVYGLWGTGIVACYDLDGKRKWIRFIDIEPLEDEGRSASPLLAGDKLIVHVSDLFCLDAKTGKTIWQKDAEPAFGTAAVVDAGGAKCVVTPTGRLFRLKDGKKLGTQLGSLSVSSPVVSGDVIYFIGETSRAVRVGVSPSGGPPPDPAKAVTPTKSVAPTRLWETKLEGNLYASPVVHEGLIHTVSKEGTYFVLDAGTGAKVFSKELEIDAELAPSLNLAGNRLFIHDDSGVTLILQPGRKFRLLAENDLGDGSVATPTFVGDRIFIRGEGKLWCVGPVRGKPLRTVGETRTAAEPAKETETEELFGDEHTERSRIIGFRGDWTGRFPDASPPLQWEKISNLMKNLRCSAAKPTNAKAGGSPAKWGAVTEWLLLGPFLDEEDKGMEHAFFDELSLQPDAGEETGGATWKAVKVKTNIADFSARLAAETGVAYAHTYILSEAGGKAGFGFKARKNLKVWLNREPRDMKYKSASVVLKAGWNRLLCKFDWAPKKKSIHAFLWNLGVSVRALPPYETETTNILWQTRLPFWSSSSPVIIGDRIYLLSEPDDLVCLNKTDGKILWIRTNNYFDSLSEAEQAKPGLTEIRKKASRLQEINDSFTEMWPSTANLKEKATLQREIRDSMVKLDKDKYDHKWGEFHGTVIGTPCSDGEAVYVWNSSGVAVRYDLEGNRQWVSQISSMTKHHGYPSSPLLIGGKFVVFLKDLVAFDADTGQVAWRNEVLKDDRLYGDHFFESPAPVEIGGKPFIYVHRKLIQAWDGKTVWQQNRLDKGNVPTAIVGGGNLIHFNSVGRFFKAKVPTSSKEPALTDEGKLNLFTDIKTNARDNLIASPLYHEGLTYVVNYDGVLFVIDTEKQEVIYTQDLALDLERRNRLHVYGTVYANPILTRDAIIVIGMTGTMVAFMPGREYRELGRNKIEQVSRHWGMPEGFSASPVAEGNRLYIRGDEYLYCIGKE